MNKKPEIEVKLSYDDRKKELTKVQFQEMINKKEKIEVDGKVTQEEELYSTIEYEMKSVFTETGIRDVFQKLQIDRKASAKRIEELEKTQKKLEVMPEDLKRLKEQLELLATYQKADKEKVEYDALKEELKVLDKGIKQIKDTIGTRLKL